MIWLAFFYAFTLSMNPYIIKRIINIVSQNTFTPQSIAWLIASYLLLHLLLVVSFRLHDYFVDIKAFPLIRSSIVKDCTARLIKKSYAHHQNHFAGQYASKINDLALSTPEFIQLIMDQFLGLFFVSLVCVITLCRVSPFFGWIMVTWIALFFLSSLFFIKTLRARSDEWSNQCTKISGVTVDILNNILSVLLFCSANHEKKIIEQETQKNITLETKLQWSYFWMWLYFGLSTFCLQGFNFYFLCKGKKEGWITSGDFAFVLTLSLSICNHIWRATKDFAHFAKIYGKITQALRSIYDDQEPEFLQKNIETIQASIRFENVHFSYDREPFFMDKSITIKTGEKIGLVGMSGSGKSTFAYLIAGLYKIDSGSIFINNEDVSCLSIESIAPHISFIPQDPALFKRTIQENIAYGCFDADLETIIGAAKKACAHDFIMSLKDGYDSVIGEVMLSGGQKQRIAIARALLKNAPILIFDEATSQIDTHIEKSIYEKIQESIQNKTVIVIAHRLSTLMLMDRILVFDQGKIIQEGKHLELMNQPGMYKTLLHSHSLL